MYWESKRNNDQKSLSVDLLDGHYHSKGENKHDTYEVHVAKAHSEYDFIFLSVSHGFVKEAVEILRKNNVKGTLVFFCNFWDTRKEVEEWAGDYVYILAFPTAGGQMQDDHLDGVLFDHLMLEGEQKADISNYSDLTTLLTSADLKWEVPHDMGFRPMWTNLIGSTFCERRGANNMQHPMKNNIYFVMSDEE